MRNTLALFAMLVAASVFTACKEDSNPSGSTNLTSPIELGKIRATTNGIERTVDASITTTSHSPRRYSVDGRTGEGLDLEYALLLGLPAELRPGTFQIGETASGDVVGASIYVKPLYCKSRTGTLVLTIVTDTTIAGTFSFDGAEEPSGSGTAQVRGGAFHASMPK